MAVALMLSRLAICLVELPPKPDSAKASIAAAVCARQRPNRHQEALDMTAQIVHALGILSCVRHR